MSLQADQSAFVGVWQLESFETRTPNGEIQYPFGKMPTGQLFYDSAGNMSAHVMREATIASRTAASGNDATAETSDRLDDYVAYFGTYSVDIAKKAVVHHVRGASIPSWVGSNQIRHYRFENGRLALSTPIPQTSGQVLTYLLVWKRI